VGEVVERLGELRMFLRQQTFLYRQNALVDRRGFIVMSLVDSDDSKIAQARCDVEVVRPQLRFENRDRAALACLGLSESQLRSVDLSQVAQAAGEVDEMVSLVSLKDLDAVLKQLLGLSAPTLRIAGKGQAVADDGDSRMLVAIDACVHVRRLSKEHLCFAVPPSARGG
jgi:hypothetical protein